MRKINYQFVALISFMIISLTSCHSSKKVAKDNYYSNPYPESRHDNGKDEQVTRKQRKTSKLDELVAEGLKDGKLRTIGIGRSFQEQYARSDANMNASAEMAASLEQSVIRVTQAYRAKTNLNKNLVEESTAKDYTETTVAQRVKNTYIVSTPEIYDLSDGSVEVHVCLECDLNKTLSDIYYDLREKKVLKADTDMQQFINDNKEQIQKLRDKVEQ